MSAITRPTPSPAGPASTCRASSNGRLRRAPAFSPTPIGVVWQWTRSAYSPYPGYRAHRRRARRVQRQVHDQPDGAARLVARDAARATRASATATSSIRRRAGNSAGCGSPITIEESDRGHDQHSHAPRSRSSRAIRRATAFAADVVAGLTATPKRLPPKYFYDVAGSELFERITTLPEYYPTRCELGILRDHAVDIAALIPQGAALIEFGSGASVKTRIVLGAAKGLAAYVPVDISADFLERQAVELREEYPGVAMLPVAADFSKPFELPIAIKGMPRVGFFPGSTIGNFEPHEACGVHAPGRRDAGPRRDVHRRRRSGEGPARAAEGLQRQAGRDREVQSQSADADQPRARRELRHLGASSITRSTTARSRASRCILPA